MRMDGYIDIDRYRYTHTNIYTFSDLSLENTNKCVSDKDYLEDSA